MALGNVKPFLQGLVEIDPDGAVAYWYHLRDLVIPAKAETYSANLWKCAVVGLDSRPSASSGQAFRGNDQPFVRDATPNDTTMDGFMDGFGVAVSRKGEYHFRHLLGIRSQGGGYNASTKGYADEFDTLPPVNTGL